MKIVAIVSEYNPFHNGHLHQIQEIRCEYGTDTAIIAIMSGHLMQRGELAITDKLTRARCAISGGVNLVLELPFPYSASSAEYFATAAVHIANSLGVVDVLSFGSECGSIELLTEIHERLASDSFIQKREQIIQTERSIGYPAATEKAFRALYDAPSFSFDPNNILAIAYLDALKRTASDIRPHTVLRIGDGYSDTEISSRYASAGAIRESLLRADLRALSCVPEGVQKILLDAYERGDILTSAERLFSAVATKFLLNSSPASDVFEGEDGLYNRISGNVPKASSISDLITLSQTKKYTRARIRRVIWNTLIGVTSSNVRTPPTFTQLLAADPVGLAILKKAKKKASIHILTKPSRFDTANALTKEQIELSHRMDALYMIALGKDHTPWEALTFTPYIQKA